MLFLEDDKEGQLQRRRTLLVEARRKRTAWVMAEDVDPEQDTLASLSTGKGHARIAQLHGDVHNGMRARLDQSRPVCSS
jgi:hypothetical protein